MVHNSGLQSIYWRKVRDGAHVLTSTDVLDPGYTHSHAVVQRYPDGWSAFTYTNRGAAIGFVGYYRYKDVAMIRAEAALSEFKPV
jgi:hypothetical protein